MSIQIQLRRDTAASWTSVNPILASGEVGVESDTNKFKIGNGTLAWNSLPYAGGGAAWGGITGTLSAQSDLQTALDAKQATSSMTAYEQVSHTTYFQPASLMTNYEQVSHTSVFQQSSLMSNYELASHTTAFQQASAMTAYEQVSHTSLFAQTSNTSLFQQTSGMTNYMNTSVSSRFAGLGTSATNASITLNTNGIAISVAAPGGGGASVNGSSGNISFANANNVTFGFNASTVTASASYPTQTVQTQGLVSGIQAQGVNGTATLSGGVFVAAGNNVTLSTGVGGYSIHANATSQLQQTSAMSLYEQTSHTSVYQLSSLMTNYAPISNTSLFQQTSQSSLFEQTSHTSVYQQSSLMTNYELASHTSIFQQTSNSSLLQQTSAMSNYQLTNDMTNFVNTSVSTKFAGTGTSATNASITLNSNGLAISVANPGGGGGIAAAALGQTFTSGTVLWAAGNNVTLSSAGQTISIHGPSPSGGGGSVYAGDYVSLSTNGAFTTVSVSGLQAVSLMTNYDAITATTKYAGTGTSATNASITLNSNGLAISVAAPGGGGGNTLSRLMPFPLNYMSTIAHSNATLMFSPVCFQQNISASRADFFASVSFTTQTNTSATSGTVSISNALFSWNASTWSQMASGSISYSFSNSSNASTSNYFGMKEMTVPLNFSASPGYYMYAWWFRTSGHTMTIAPMIVSHQTNAFSGDWGAASATSAQMFPGGGFSSISLTTAMPTAIPITAVQGASAGVLRFPVIEFVNKDLG
jgi:hypothetical protein